MKNANALPPGLAAMAEEAPAAVQTEELTVRIVQKMRHIRDETLAIEEAEEALRTRKGKLLMEREKWLPDLLDEAGTDKWALPAEGNHPVYDVTLKPYYNAKITEESNDEACDWLFANGHGAIVKRSFTVSFGKDDAKRAEKFAKLIDKYDYVDECEEKNGVHAGTLKAFVKERIVDYGETLPKDLLGITVGRIAELKERKEKVTKTKRK